MLHLFRHTAEQVIQTNIQLLLNPLGPEKYKVITVQEKLNRLLYEKVVRGNEQVRVFKLLLTRGRVHLRGIIKEPENVPWNIKLGEIYFDLSLAKEEVRDEKVILHIVGFKIFNPKKKFDLVKWINKYSVRIRREILAALTENSPLFIEEPMEKIGFDLRFVLKKVPPEMKTLGRFRILNVTFEKKRIIWYIESNLLQKSMIDLLGPTYIDVEKMDLSSDALRLLTDFPFDLLR